MIDRLNCPSCHYSYHHNDSYAYVSVDEKRRKWKIERWSFRREEKWNEWNAESHKNIHAHKRRCSCEMISYCCNSAAGKFLFYVRDLKCFCRKFSWWIWTFSSNSCIILRWCSLSSHNVTRNTIFSVEIWALINAMMNKINVRRQMRVENGPSFLCNAQWKYFRDFIQFFSRFNFFSLWCFFFAFDVTKNVVFHFVYMQS